MSIIFHFYESKKIFNYSVPFGSNNINSYKVYPSLSSNTLDKCASFSNIMETKTNKCTCETS